MNQHDIDLALTIAFIAEHGSPIDAAIFSMFAAAARASRDGDAYLSAYALDRDLGLKDKRSSRSIARLIEMGVLEDTGREKPTHRGRPVPIRRPLYRSDLGTDAIPRRSVPTDSDSLTPRPHREGQGIDPDQPSEPPF